jgi:hypothetical protein
MREYKVANQDFVCSIQNRTSDLDSASSSSSTSVSDSFSSSAFSSASASTSSSAFPGKSDQFGFYREGASKGPRRSATKIGHPILNIQYRTSDSE